MSESRRVWVFGGGGLGGIAWETGMLMRTTSATQDIDVPPRMSLLG